MISAFGVDHGEIAKADKPSSGGASIGRHAATQVFPGWHGAVAGRKGKKLRSFGTEAGTTIGGGLGGGAVGAGIGALATKGKPVGAMVGGMLGAQAGGRTWLAHQTTRNNKLGRYKKQTKA